MKKLFKLTKGTKTYIASLIAIAIGIYYSNIDLIMLGLIGAGLRAAMK